MPELQVLRDEPRPYATCPNCRTRLELPGMDGLRYTYVSLRDRGVAFDT